VRSYLYRLAVASTLFVTTAAIQACGAPSLTTVDAIQADHLEVVRGDTRIADTTVADLRAFDASEVLQGEHAEQGVQLATLLDELKIERPADATLEAIGADGYAVQLDPTTIAAADTLVVFAVDGEALPDHKGPLRLLVAEDRAKSVRNLRRIVLK